LTYILHIETATPVCSVALSSQNKILVLKETSEENAHSSRITIFIEECLKEAGIEAKNLKAVALSAGPGSYTGLRIGAATAKGLCYALNIPLISVSTLHSMALGYLSVINKKVTNFLLCPMIDARRMEVYYALYDNGLKEVKSPAAEVVTENFLSDISGNRVFFFGTGASKCKDLLTDKKFNFEEGNYNSARYLVETAHDKFEAKEFENLAYFELLYLKEFYTKTPAKL
jgi:tRNA threonylcarbamoyladenosine biosynthesis protein TsaB